MANVVVKWLVATSKTVIHNQASLDVSVDRMQLTATQLQTATVQNAATASQQDNADLTQIEQVMAIVQPISLAKTAKQAPNIA